MADFEDRVPILSPIYEMIGVRSKGHTLPFLLGWMWCRLTRPDEHERVVFIETYYKRYLSASSNPAYMMRKLQNLFDLNAIDVPMTDDVLGQVWTFLRDTLAHFPAFPLVFGTPEMDIVQHIVKRSAVLDVMLDTPALRVLFLLVVSASGNQWAKIWVHHYQWPQVFTRTNHTYQAITQLAKGPAPSAAFFGALITDVIQTLATVAAAAAPSPADAAAAAMMSSSSSSSSLYSTSLTTVM